MFLPPTLRFEKKLLADVAKDCALQTLMDLLRAFRTLYFTLLYVCMYVRMYVCMYICMYVIILHAYTNQQREQERDPVGIPMLPCSLLGRPRDATHDYLHRESHTNHDNIWAFILNLHGAVTHYGGHRGRNQRQRQP